MRTLKAFVRGSFLECIRDMVAASILLGSIAAVGAVDVGAQTPAEARQIPDLGGTWDQDTRSGQGSCDGFPNDSRNLPRRGCRFSADQLQLTARAVAWIEFQDEPLQGRFHCVAESMPSMFVQDNVVRIDQRADRVVMEWLESHNNVTRTIWTDGRGHPSPNDPAYVSYWGHSVGRYEGDELVVATRNFTFDPNGIDGQAQIPSGWRKRITERYSRIAPDRLRLVFTVEDPDFLKEPYTETVEFALSDHQIEWVECDPEIASVPLRMLPPKYPDE